MDRLSKDASIEAGIRAVAGVVHNLTHLPTKTPRTKLQQFRESVSLPAEHREADE